MPSKTNDIYEQLKEDLTRLRFRSDEIINERTLAERYNVSKTPVREALSVLVQEGYLKKIPRVGYLVREITEEDYRKITYLRLTLERGVVLQILRKCTDEEIRSLEPLCQDTVVAYSDFGSANFDFHMAMAELTGNEYLADEVRRVFQRTIRLPSKHFYHRISGDLHAQHRALVSALLCRDEEKALAIIEEECRVDELDNS